jgi:DNA modification methylase
MKLTLIQGDALKVLPTLPSESVDLIVTDPPYFNKGMKPAYKRKGHKDVITYFGEWDVFNSDKDYLEFINNFIDEAKRVMKPNSSVYIFTNDRFISYIRHIIKSKELKYASTIVWHKYNSPPRFIEVAGFISSKEIIAFAYKGKPTFNKPIDFKELLDVWITPQTPSNERTGHPTQKPLSLIKKIINISSNEGDTILDPFLGSGTTMVAALELKRNCIGIEINKEYIEMVKKRLNWGLYLQKDIEWEFRVME